MDQQQREQVAYKLLTQRISLEKFYEKLTEQARAVLGYADEEAALFNHTYIGTEHLLLGLLRQQDGLAAVVLKENGIELEAARKVIEQIIGRGEPLGADVERHMTPRTQVVVWMAASEAWRFNFIGTEHLLLGLLREGEGIAAVTLERLGASLEQLRIRTLQTVFTFTSTSATSLKDVVGKSKGNVVTCRIDDQDLDAIDALIETGIRSTRSDAASWLIHAGILANQAIFESVYATVTEIRSLRAQAQAMAQMIAQPKAASSSTKAIASPENEK